MPPPEQKASRGLFLEPIRRVVSQVHAILTISPEAVNFLDLQLFQLLQRLCSSNFTTVEEIRDVVVAFLPEDITEWAMKEAQQILAVAESYKAGGTATSKKGFEGVAFPPEILSSTNFFMSAVPDQDASLFVMAVLEYVCADVLKLAGNYAENHHRRIIDVGDIRATLRLDSSLQQLFVKVRSDLLLAHISKQVERSGRYMSLVLKVIADCVKPLKDHGFLEMFANCTKAMQFHNEVSKILSDAVGYPGVIQVIEHLQASKQFFVEYAKEFEKSVPEIDTWRNSTNTRKMLEDRDLHRAVEYQMKRLLWQPLNTVITVLSALTNLIHLMPTEQALLQLAKEFSGLGSDFNEIARKYECEIDADQDWRAPLWKHLDFTELQSKMEGWTGKNLTSLETKLCKEGTLGAINVTGGVRKDKKPKERIFWLFDKILISGKPADFMTTKKGYFYEVKEIVNVNTLSVREAVPDLEDAKTAFEVVRENESFIIVTKSEKERGEWLAAFYREITWAKLAYALEKVLMQEAFQGPELPPSLRLTETEYRFAVPDSPENILFEINETGGAPLIKGGTVLKLVERLTFDKYADTNYLLQFLLTYRSFMEPLELLNLLIERFNYPTPKSASEEELEYFRTTIRRPVQLRVTNVVKNWVDKHYLDFQESKELLKRFLEFVKDDIASAQEMEKVVASLTKAIRKKREDETDLTNRKSFVLAPNEVVPDPIRTGIVAGFIDIMDLDPLEVARQLTLIEDKFYKAIPSYQCLNQRWAKKNKEKEAPHILVMIDRFNRVSNWVKTFVVYRKEYQSRVDIIERFIKIAEKCMEINNFNAMTEIISGLNSIPVNRLRLTWAGVSKKSLTSFQDMAALMAPEKNYSKFRKHLHTRDPPCLPYFGVYLTDLTFIDDGNKDLIPGTDLINFGKRRKTAAVISEIQQYQNLWFKFQEIPELHEYLSDLHVEEDEECYQRSLEIEPRQSIRTESDGSNSSGTLERTPSNLDISKASEPAGPKEQTRKPSMPNIAIGKSLSSFGSMLKNVSVATSTAISKVGDSINEAKLKSEQKAKDAKDAKEKAKAEASCSNEDINRKSSAAASKRFEDDPAMLPEERERTTSSAAPPIPHRDRSNLN